MPARLTNVLIVDDDEAVRSALKFALELDVFNVIVHSRAIDVLADPGLGTIDCLVASDGLPGMDCFQLIDRLRQLGLRIPAIVVTGNATQLVRYRASACGARLVLEKPLMENSLVDAIHAVREQAA